MSREEGPIARTSPKRHPKCTVATIPGGPDSIIIGLCMVFDPQPHAPLPIQVQMLLSTAPWFLSDNPKPLTLNPKPTGTPPEHDILMDLVLAGSGDLVSR